jgi:hypothetical protein
VLQLVTSSDLTATRELDLVTGDADRTITLGGNLTVSGNATIPAGTALVVGGVLTEPQGYLTPTSGTPIITSDASAATSVWYEPFRGNRVPLITGGVLHLRTFTALELALNNPNHVASTLYDVFLDWDGAAVRIGTGPAWQTSTAGSGARGTGAGTTEIERSSVHGLWVNAEDVSARNGSSTYTIEAGEGLYVGSIFIDSSAGHVTCHRAWGQSRKWSVWNAFNRQTLYLKGGDSTASWSYDDTTIRPANNASANSLSVFCGLADEPIQLGYGQFIRDDGGPDSLFYVGIGWNSTTAMSGRRGSMGTRRTTGTGENWVPRGNGVAHFFQAPSLGVNVVTALEAKGTSEAGGATLFGGEDDMVLSAMWRG